MTKTQRLLIMLVLLVGLGALVCWFFCARPDDSLAVPVSESQESMSAPVPVPVAEAPQVRTVDLSTIPDADSHFRLTIEIPATWQVASVSAIGGINIYDPAASGTTPLEQSQIFLRYFEADTFLTLSTVDVLERTELTIADRAAVRYRIKKKASVADFANQPSWRNTEHEVTDIRESSSNPSAFYVIARNPALSESVFNQVLDSLSFTADPVAAAISDPVEGFASRVTLKPFGILITKDTSPVQPEKFSGYHTAADAEFTSDADRDREIPVSSILDGTVVASRTASGYGGVIVIKHELNRKQVFGIYGHLQPSSMLPVGSEVKRNDRIAVLGAGGTAETDGERKHLHFGIYTGSTASIAGYVSTKNALDQWLDPLPLLLP